jgi:8-oxo-dGTP pyrophosphatase MutT (NUDIX family)
MVKLVFPHGVWWVMPGGGIEENEDLHTALQRELAEEVGLSEFEAEGVLWLRDHHFDMSSTDGVQWDGQSETV